MFSCEAQLSSNNEIIPVTVGNVYFDKCLFLASKLWQVDVSTYNGCVIVDHKHQKTSGDVLIMVF